MNRRVEKSIVEGVKLETPLLAPSSAIGSPGSSHSLCHAIGRLCARMQGPREAQLPEVLRAS